MGNIFSVFLFVVIISSLVSFSCQDGCSEAETADLTERCELISDRLLTLEDELQMAILNRDQALTHILSLLPKYTYII